MFNVIINLITRRRNRAAAVARVERLAASVQAHKRPTTPANIQRAA